MRTGVPRELLDVVDQIYHALTKLILKTDLLYKEPVNSEATSLPSPEFFKNKILIKVSVTAVKFLVTLEIQISKAASVVVV